MKSHKIRIVDYNVPEVNIKHRPCPFHIRKLEAGERCYYGNGVNRCKYFKKYITEHDAGYVMCSYLFVPDEQEEQWKQQSLF